ncbi:MAG: hypothetical protein OEY89_15040 [Gammaproteobacteria bacterium]|nr:hypothetical protein [Gammaproteobacteria bacterium]
MSNVFKGRYGLIYLFILIFIGLATLTRLVLVTRSFNLIDTDIGGIGLAFMVGLFMDLITASYMSIPLILY